MRLGLNQIICTPTDLLPLHMLVLFRLSTVLLVWIVALFVRNLILISHILGMSISPELMSEQPNEGGDNSIESLLTMSRNVLTFSLNDD